MRDMISLNNENDSSDDVGSYDDEEEYGAYGEGRRNRNYRDNIDDLWFLIEIEIVKHKREE